MSREWTEQEKQEQKEKINAYNRERRRLKAEKEALAKSIRNGETDQPIIDRDNAVESTESLEQPTRVEEQLSQVEPQPVQEEVRRSVGRPSTVTPEERVKNLEAMLSTVQEQLNSLSGRMKTDTRVPTQESDLLPTPQTYWINQVGHVMSDYVVDGITYISPTLSRTKDSVVYNVGTPIIFKHVNVSRKRNTYNTKEDEMIHLSKYSTRDPKIARFIENSPDFKSGRIFKKVVDPKNIDMYKKRFQEKARGMVAGMSNQDIVFRVLNEKDQSGNLLVKRSDDYGKMREELVSLYADRFEQEDKKNVEMRLKQVGMQALSASEKELFFGLTGQR